MKMAALLLHRQGIGGQLEILNLMVRPQISPMTLTRVYFNCRALFALKTASKWR